MRVRFVFVLILGIWALFGVAKSVLAQNNIPSSENQTEGLLENPYQELLEANPFSPHRKYTPYRKKEGKKGASPDLYQKNLVLRGTFILGQKPGAILEVKPRLKRELSLNGTYVRITKGEALGDCVLEEVQRGKVVFGGACGELKLSLRESPERHQPLKLKPSNLAPSSTSKKKISRPVSKSFPPPNPAQKQKSNRTTTKKPPNPFKALLEKYRNRNP